MAAGAERCALPALTPRLPSPPPHQMNRALLGVLDASANQGTKGLIELLVVGEAEEGGGHGGAVDQPPPFSSALEQRDSIQRRLKKAKDGDENSKGSGRNIRSRTRSLKNPSIFEA